MAVPLADLNIRITANTAQFNTAITQVTNRLGSLTQTAIGTALGFAGLNSAVGILERIKDAIGFAISTAASNEQAITSFKVMLGSAQEARDMMAEIRELARVSPMGTEGLKNAAQTMMQFGVAGDDVIPMLKVLGDIVGGDNERLHRMALVFGQTTAAGRLMGQDLLQMVNAGFNPLKQISDKTGESMADLKKRMEAGGVSAAEVTQAFIDATQAGGRFNGMMGEQAQTFSGRWATLKDDIQLLALSIGEDLLPAAKDAINVLRELTEQFRYSAEFTKAFWHEIDNTNGPLRWLFGTMTRAPEFQRHFKPPKIDRRDVDDLARRTADALAMANKTEADWKAWADKLKETLREPWEVLVDEFVKIDTTFSAGLLSAEEYVKALDQLIGKFDKTSQAKQELNRIDTQGVGAATRFSVGGFSAAVSGTSALNQLTRQIANYAATTAESTRGILDYLRGQQAVIVAAGVR